MTFGKTDIVNQVNCCKFVVNSIFHTYQQKAKTLDLQGFSRFSYY